MHDKYFGSCLLFTALRFTLGKRRDKVMLGPLPDDFLQMNGGAVATPMNYHPAVFGGFHPNGGMLCLTVVQVFNYIDYSKKNERRC